MRPKYNLQLSIFGIAAFTLSQVGIVQFVQAGSPEAIEAGKKEFRENCAVCHGADAMGDGPLASQLKTAPPDLTTIAERNDGIFPYGKVIEMIDGRADVISHGGREMPVWGERFSLEGNLTSSQGRILNLALYLDSIQTK